MGEFFVSTRRLAPSFPPPPSPPSPSQTMINWKRLDAWRANPLLTHTMRASAPGFLLGAAAFAVYVAYDKTAGKKEGGGHH